MSIRTTLLILALCLLPKASYSQSVSGSVFSPSKSFAPVIMSNSGHDGKPRKTTHTEPKEEKNYKSINPFTVGEEDNDDYEEVVAQENIKQELTPKRFIKTNNERVYHVQRVVPPRKKLINSPNDNPFQLYDLTITEQTPEIRTSLGSIFEIKLREEEGTKWHFDYDDVIVSYYEEEKIKNHLSLFFYSVNYGETEIFLDLVKNDSFSNGELIKKIKLKVKTTENY